MAGEILRPPRLTGNAEADLGGVVEFLWAIYRALVTELQFVRSQDADPEIISDEQLAALAALVPTASANLPYFTAVNAAALTGLSTFMRTLLDDASAAVARGTLGLGALAVLDTVGAAVLTDDSVTYAKIQEVPQDRILGRQTASTGNIEEIPCTSAGRALMDDADAAAQRTTLGLVIGTNVQAYSANLSEYAAVNPTAQGLALLDDASAADQRTTIGLGTIATENAGLNVTITTAKLTALGADGSMTFTAGILTAQTAAT